MSKLSTRLALGTALGMSAVLALTLAMAGWLIKNQLEQQLDRELARLLRSNAENVFRDHTRRIVPGLRRRRQVMPDDLTRGTSETSPFYLQCWSSDGDTIVAPTGLGEAELPRIAENLETLPLRAISDLRPRFVDFRLPSGFAGRAAGFRFTVPDRTTSAFREGRTIDLELVVAVDTRPLNATLTQVLSLLAIGWFAASVVCTLIIVWQTRRSLRPLDDVVRRIATTPSTGDVRAIDTQDTPAELVPVVTRLNAFVVQLRAALTQERAFASAAAHELRTPVAGLRATLEVALRRSRSREEIEQAARNCLDIVLEMEALIESLLQLARGSSASRGMLEVELAEVVSEAWDSCAELAKSRELQLCSSIEPGFAVRVDPTMLRRILANLMANAAAYADPGTVIDARARLSENEVLLEVENHVSDAPPDLADRAFEPFWRKDGAGEARKNLGIGLTLARRIAEALGGALTARQSGNQFTAVLRFPS